MCASSNNPPAANALKQIVAEVLAAFKHPSLSQDLGQMQALHHVVSLNRTLHIELTMPFAWQSGFSDLQHAVSDQLIQQTGVDKIEWRLQTRIATLKRANDRPPIKQVKNIIAVSSGKGGVGKSSVAVNLALALAAEGGRVSLLDADIYGPSIPTMLGAQQTRFTSPDGKHIAPIQAWGIASNSIGYLAPSDNAMIWRGPMASKALLQLANETLWPPTDYLIIDMPPGTGDIQLTLAQNMPVTAALVVTTPQDIALIDARKGIALFDKVAVKVLGVVENMSCYSCPRCGHQEAIFGEGGAAQLAKTCLVPLLAQIPLHKALQQDLDAGEPTVVRHPTSELTARFRQLAACVAAQLYWTGQTILDDIAVQMQ